MKFSFLFLLFLLSNVSANSTKYLDNKSCDECHEGIYEEYQGSAHARGYFNDALHHAIADKVSDKTYACATCHMPMADNLKALISGEARPDKSNKTHTDAISCYFCHTIAYVKKAHKFNVNTKSRQAKGYKPTLYGRLIKPEDSDKHSSINNPVYAKNACSGCHSHKLNDNNVTIFRAMSDKQNSLECIKCHMPELEGGAEKLDKRARGQHASHKFLGIHDEKFRTTGLDINISSTQNTIMISLYNKMSHPLIVQPARVKYLKLTVLREGKEIWKNYKTDPREDKKVFFEFTFKGKDGKKIIIPANAYSYLRVNNLEAKERKTFEYKGMNLEKGDVINASMYVRMAKKDCQKVVELKEEKFKKAFLLKSVEKIID